jgi:hypothetical protein
MHISTLPGAIDVWNSLSLEERITAYRVLGLWPTKSAPELAAKVEPIIAAGQKVKVKDFCRWGGGRQAQKNLIWFDTLYGRDKRHANKMSTDLSRPEHLGFSLPRVLWALGYMS